MTRFTYPSINFFNFFSLTPKGKKKKPKNPSTNILDINWLLISTDKRCKVVGMESTVKLAL